MTKAQQAMFCEVTRRCQFGPKPKEVMGRLEMLRQSGFLQMSDEDFGRLSRTIPSQIMDRENMRAVSLEYRLGYGTSGVVATWAAHLAIINHVWKDVQLNLPEDPPSLLLGDDSHVPGVRWVELNNTGDLPLAADQFLALQWLYPDLTEQGRSRIDRFILSSFKAGGYSWEGERLDLRATLLTGSQFSLLAEKTRDDSQQRLLFRIFLAHVGSIG